ncbi:hypothetical protein BGZ59_010122, partial [Podila verticillata]
TALLRNGISDVTSLSFYDLRWQGLLDLRLKAFTELQILDFQYPEFLATTGSLKWLTVEVTDRVFDKELDQILHINQTLQGVDIAVQGRAVLDRAEAAFRMRSVPAPYQLTLLERTNGYRGRILARFMVSAITNNDRGDTTFEDSHLPIGNKLGAITVSEWNCDHLFVSLSDYSVTLLDAATTQHPSVLLSLTLNISSLSECSLACLQNVLQRSCLEHLNVHCTSFDPRLSNALHQVLHAVPWSTLKSLVLFGDSIDEWIQAWVGNESLSLSDAFSEDPALLHFEIGGTGSTPQQLSHESAMFIHRFICTGLLVGLSLKNIELKEVYDWILLVEAIDYDVLETFCLSEQNLCQLMEVKDVWGILLSVFDVIADPWIITESAE